MIDHLTARRTLAGSIDFSLDAGDAQALDAHLHRCISCRSFGASLRTDAAVLRDLDFGPVPVAVRASVAIAAERRGGRGVNRWFALVAVGAVLLVALGGGVLGAGGSATTGLGSNGNAIQWTTDVVDFQADDFWIQANGRRFTAAVPQVGLNSDPGNATYRTLEATWQEHGVEMRLNLYFGGDESSWWVSEIRIYDGKPRGEWVTWTGTWFRAPIGAAWTGDLELSAPGGTLHMGGLVLRSMPFDGVNEPVGGGIALPADARPFSKGGALYCSGILQLAPKEAELALLGLGYRLSWRLDTTTGPNTGFSEVMANAPAGVIHQEPLPGTGGELIVFVAPFGDPQAVPLPFPSDCPAVDGESPVLEPVAPTPVLAPTSAP